ncbi:MAG: toprim domain-containing protein [Elusimicrobiota bacterium]|nr:toprim domain-containing protein [Elusimicrobiota bacterium]
MAITEGIMDCVSITNFIGTALMSANISKKQIQKISEKGVKEIIMIPDQDETGLLTLQRNINDLYYYYPPSLNLNVYIYNIPNGFKDFNEYYIKSEDGNIYTERLKKYKKNSLSVFSAPKRRKLII